MKYKLLALDIDGTVVKEHTNDISLVVQTAIAAAREKVVVTLVSARAWKDQKIIVDALGLQDMYHVLENGTKVMNPSGELEYTKVIPAQEALAIQRLAEEFCESIGFCVDGAWLAEHPASMEDVVTTLSLIATKEKAIHIKSLIDQIPQQYAVTVGNHWSEADWSVVLVSHKDASKGGGLRYVQEKLGISPEETIAVGDGASDVPMMPYAAVKVAMGNAEDSLKQVSTDIVSSVIDDGVAEVIEKYILQD